MLADSGCVAMTMKLGGCTWKILRVCLFTVYIFIVDVAR